MSVLNKSHSVFTSEIVWRVEEIPSPHHIASRQLRLEVLQTKNGKCCFCKQPLYLGQTIRVASHTKAIKINGQVCKKCGILFVKDANTLSSVAERIQTIKETERSAQKKRYDLKKDSSSFGNVAVESEKIHDETESEVFDLSYYLIPEFSSESDVFLYDGLLPCHWKKHTTENYHARMMGLKEEEIGFYVEYCRKCKRFYMNTEDYRAYLKKLKFFPTRIESYYVLKNDHNPSYDSGYYDPLYENRAEQSPLMLNGYTVSEAANLSADTREQILKYIIDYNILEKSRVLDYLRLFIREREGNSRMSKAVGKWKEDIEKVKEHRLGEHPKVNIARLVYRQRKTGDGSLSST